MSINEHKPLVYDGWIVPDCWHAKIDYVSVTSSRFHFAPSNALAPHFGVTTEARMALGEILSHQWDTESLKDWTSCGGRSGYTRGARHPIGMTFYAGHATAKPLLEIGGAACDWLHSLDALLPLVQRECEGITRLDLAGDITCIVSPAEFVYAGYSGLVRTKSSVSSSTGSTEYLGSPTSDRSARVYRYAPPHPRSDALRVEIVLRRELAKSAALELCARSVSDVWSSAAKPLSFKHPMWRQTATDTLPRLTMKSEPTSASRLQWLTKQIKPAVLEAHRTGLIDITQWLEEL